MGISAIFLFCDIVGEDAAASLFEVSRGLSDGSFLQGPWLGQIVVDL
jgi:hypothetical protein